MTKTSVLEEGISDGICALLLEHTPAAVAIFDLEMRYLGVSRRWLIDYRIETPDILGQSHYAIFPETDDRMRETHRRVMSGESLSSSAEPFRRQDGSLLWVRWQMFPWRRADGVIGGAVLFTELMSDPARTREWLVALDTELTLLIQNTVHTSIFLLDTEGRVSVWNDGAERMFGWTAEEILGEPSARLFSDEDQQSGEPAATLARASREAAPPIKALRICKDGRRLSGTSAVAQIHDDNDVLVGFAMAFRDNTEENERIARIEAREAQLTSVLQTVPDAMVTMDEFGIVESFSAAAERLFGYRADEVVGQNVVMLMTEPDASRHDGYLRHYLKSGQRRIIGSMRRVFGRRKNGSLFPHELYVGEALGGGRRVFTGFIRDLTAREKAVAELHEVQAELIHISRVSAIGTMATALAHDLNQPLTAITNYVQSASAMIASSAEDQMLDLVREGLDEAGREAMRAGAIVRRLRDFVARGELERTMETVQGIVSDACVIASVNGSARGVSCDLDFSDNLDPVLIDRVQIQQVLINLIQNAVEAMDSKGALRIGAQQLDDMVRVTVKDSGPGIPVGKEGAVFEPFISSKSSGMGLGLAICRTIVEAHGGKLWCSNAPDGGAEFHFTLPLAETPDE